MPTPEGCAEDGGITNVRAWPTDAGVCGASVTYTLGSPVEEFMWRSAKIVGMSTSVDLSSPTGTWCPLWFRLCVWAKDSLSWRFNQNVLIFQLHDHIFLRVWAIAVAVYEELLMCRI